MSASTSLRHGLLDTDGAELYWEESGAAQGTPGLYLHGGPGGRLGTGGYRDFFDPSRYRVIGFEQRGSGRSTPSASDLRVALPGHTTARLIADIEALRRHLGIERWVVVGVSWGSTLALAYAEEHPHRVRALGLLAVTTTSRAEVDWITEGVGRFFPEEWAAFETASERRPGERVVEAYARRLAGADDVDRARAAEMWDLWESVHVSLDHPELRGRGHVGPERRELFATLVTHYWAHDAFLPGDRAVLARLDLLTGIPAALVHGRRDLSSPPDTAYRVHRGIPGSTLVVVDDEGHGGPVQSAVLRRALDDFAALD